MGVNLPGPEISLSSVGSGTATIHFDADPAGVVVTSKRVVWGYVDSTSMTLSSAADAADDVVLSGLTEDVFVLAMGFAYNAGGDAYGPGNVLVFSCPYNIYDNLEANNTAMQRVVNGLTGKVTNNDFLYYGGIIETRMTDLESRTESLSTRIERLLASISAFLRSS